jgi:toxin ParE1/3/4
VSAYRLARLAETDLKSIVRYTLKTWGRAQTIRYRQGLQECFQLLADNPSIGRNCDSIHLGLRRFEVGKHVVFYRLNPGGIRIVRVLHQQMIPAKLRFEQ